MKTTVELFLQRSVNHAMSLHHVLAREFCADDCEAEVCAIAVNGQRPPTCLDVDARVSDLSPTVCIAVWCLCLQESFTTSNSVGFSSLVSCDVTMRTRQSRKLRNRRYLRANCGLHRPWLRSDFHCSHGSSQEDAPGRERAASEHEKLTRSSNAVFSSFVSICRKGRIAVMLTTCLKSVQCLCSIKRYIRRRRPLCHRALRRRLRSTVFVTTQQSRCSTVSWANVFSCTLKREPHHVLG